MKKYIFMFSIIFSLNSWARHQGSSVEPLSFDEFLSLPVSARVDYLKAVQYVLLQVEKKHKNLPVEYEASWLEPLLQASRAWATSERKNRNCVIAGWVFKFEQGKCRLSTKMDLLKKSDCRIGQEIPCNPLIFGLGNNNKPWCISVADKKFNQATQRCMKEFEESGKSYRDLAVEMKVLKEYKQWDQLAQKLSTEKGKNVPASKAVQVALQEYCPASTDPSKLVYPEQKPICEYFQKIKSWVKTRSSQKRGSSGAKNPSSPKQPPSPPAAVQGGPKSAFDEMREVLKCQGVVSGCPRNVYTPPAWGDVTLNQVKEATGSNRKEAFLKYFGVSYDMAKYTLCGPADSQQFLQRIGNVRMAQRKMIQDYLKVTAKGQKGYEAWGNLRSNVRELRKTYLNGSHHGYVENFLKKEAIKPKIKNQLATTYQQFYQCAIRAADPGGEGGLCQKETVAKKDLKKTGWFSRESFAQVIKRDFLAVKALAKGRVSRKVCYPMEVTLKGGKSFPVYSTTSLTEEEDFETEPSYEDRVEYWDTRTHKVNNIGQVISYTRYCCTISSSRNSKGGASKRSEGAR
ncbi:MAG: hypothetical protein D6797_01205 [Bdellovibrio sp.]|nr:MAG: hypothetical protein D6797_01205 [Bdellovibrio sp.]